MPIQSSYIHNRLTCTRRSAKRPDLSQKMEKSKRTFFFLLWVLGRCLSSRGRVRVDVCVLVCVAPTTWSAPRTQKYASHVLALIWTGDKVKTKSNTRARHRHRWWHRWHRDRRRRRLRLPLLLPLLLLERRPPTMPPPSAAAGATAAASVRYAVCLLK